MTGAELRLPAYLELRPPAVEAVVRAGLAPRAEVQVIAQQMLRAVRVSRVGAMTSIQMELSTGRLSRLSLDLTMQRGRLVARFGGADASCLAALQRATSDLEAALSARGVQVEAIEFREQQQPLGNGRQPPARGDSRGSRGGQDHGGREEVSRLPGPRSSAGAGRGARSVDRWVDRRR